MTGLLYIHICRKGILIYIGKDVINLYRFVVQRFDQNDIFVGNVIPWIYSDTMYVGQERIDSN